MRADGKRGYKEVAGVGFCLCSRFPQAKLKAFRAARAALGFVFKPSYGFEVHFRLVTSLNKGYTVLEGHLSQKPKLRIEPSAVFLRGEDVWIIVEKQNFKMLGKIFEHVTAARTAAAVKQKPRWLGGRKISDKLIKFKLIVCFIQIFSPPRAPN